VRSSRCATVPAHRWAKFGDCLHKNSRGSNWARKFARTCRFLRRPMCAQCCVGKARSPGIAAQSMHDHTAPLRSKRFAEELARLWNERHRTLNWRLARRYPREFMKLVDAAIDSLAPNFTSAPRMLREQLGAEGVSVRVSVGCIAEFARIASAAAAPMRQVNEPYRSCLRQEIASCSRFIREWTSSDKKFDQAQWGEFVSIARKYALPRSWTLCESVASVSGPTVLTSVARKRLQVRYFPRAAVFTSLGANKKAGPPVRPRNLSLRPVADSETVTASPCSRRRRGRCSAAGLWNAS
jgi:hypothetical protein